MLIQHTPSAPSSQALEAYLEAQRQNPESKDLVGKIRELQKLTKKAGRKVP